MQILNTSSKWHLVRVKFTKEFQDGTLKRVTEPYLVSAVSFTDAEATINAEVGEFIRGEFIVCGITKQNYVDILYYDDSDMWWKCKVSYTAEDDNGKEKKVNQNILCSAPTAKDVYERVTDHFKTALSVFELGAISLTKIVEVIPIKTE